VNRKTVGVVIGMGLNKISRVILDVLLNMPA
jgi:hypothetical protein